jgi:hypothetical protein
MRHSCHIERVFGLSTNPTQPRISVVVPTATGWPQARLALDTIMPQLRRAGGQLVVADVSGRPPPYALASAPDVEWLSLPGEWIIRARRAAYDRADGEIVALTEDHCTVAEDWVERILESHARHPEAVAITGAIENGTPEHVADWALYLTAHVRLAPPLPAKPDLVGKTNVSYKRAVLRAMPREGSLSIEDLYNRELLRRGSVIATDDAIRVAHHQCSSTRQLVELQFHNGRMIGGVRARSMDRSDLLRLLLPGPLAAFRLARTAAVAVRRDVGLGRVLSALPLVAVMHLVHAAGEGIGYLRGPGSSPNHLH